MADDMIDIEEHDVMENPMIKQIFPDLSILKKEIIDYNNEIKEDLLNSKAHHIDETVHLLHRNVNKSNADKPLNANTCYNKIILGSTRNKNIAPKIFLHNVRPKLIRSKKFCQTCLILFPTKEALHNHRMLCHNDMDHGKTWRQQTNINSNIIKEQSEIFTNDVNLKCPGNDFENDINEVECTSQNDITDVNVMVKINEPHIKSMDKDLIKPCFHCSAIFPSRQSLIDHLYEILNNKNSNFQSVESKINKDVFPKNDKILQNVIHRQRQNIALTKAEYIQNNILYYSCPICSYYFVEEKLYKRHMLSKHNISKKIDVERIEFCSKCKFCRLSYNCVFSYNEHLIKKHTNQMIKTKTDDLFPLNKNQDLQSKNLTLTCKKSATHQIDAPKRNTKLVSEHLKSEENKIFKRRFDDVRIMALKAILFKCIECNIHFLTSEAAKNHFVHSELLQNWKCTNCQKLFKQNQQNLHEKQHKYSSYFTVVEVNNDSRVIYKCPKCSGHFRKENFADHQFSCVSKLETCSDVLVDHDQEVTFQKTGSIPDCSVIVDDKSDTTEKLNNIKQKADMVTLMKKCKLIYYFCNVCKCNIPKSCNMEDHFRSRCTRFIKNVCEFCGLVFINKSISSHKKLHQKYNLKLQDFTFFDLKTKTKMRPISDLLKCGSCEKYFINEYEVVHHFCDEGNYITCPVCKIELTDSSFKLHEPFHSYKLRILSKSKIPASQPSRNLMFSDIGSSVAEVTNDDQNLSSFSFNTRRVEEGPYLYTCKNCDISMNTYDDVVEHCHSHTHLNKIEIDVIECTMCNVNFISSSYNRHQQLHLICLKEKFKYLNFDILYFSVHNDEWLGHVFRTLPKDTTNNIIDKSIYKYENKIRMEIIQNGPYELTIYKCDKCHSFIDGKSIYQHIVNCSNDSVKFYCKICNIPFISNISRNEHEKIHLNLKITLKSYRIVIFNREQDKVINQNVSKTKYYVLFECRYCHVVVDKNMYKNHECNSLNCKRCNNCGLLVQEREFDGHILKHKVIDSFNKNVMKVVLIGDKTINEQKVKTNNLISTFSGMVCDYTFYKCVNCDVCIREFRNTSQHYCLIDAAKSKCPQCDLIFDEGKIKGHLKLHETDPDFTKDTIIVKTFDCNKLNKKKYSEIENVNIKSHNNIDHKGEVMVLDAGVGGHINNISDNICISEAIAKIYKCYCGLHFINQTQIKEHLNKCLGIVKVNQSRQDCFKCGLTFSSNVLFKHLLEHHGGKNVVFKYEIVDNFNEGATNSL